MFSFLKKLFKGFDPDMTDSEETVTTNDGGVDYDALWEAVTAKLAKELKTNTRYISAVINSRFNTNFSCLINEYRIKEALHRMVDKRYAEETIEEISAAVGFANRQSFYAAFYRIMGETPNSYRKRQSAKK